MNLPVSQDSNFLLNSAAAGHKYAEKLSRVDEFEFTADAQNCLRRLSYMRSTSFCRGILLLSGFRTVGSAKIKRLSTVNGPLSSYFASPIACKSKYDATTVDKIIKYMRGNAPPVETEPCFGIDSSISKTGLCLGDLTLQF